MSNLTPQDFLNSAFWCTKMVEFGFKKGDVNGDGYICHEDMKTLQTTFDDYARNQPGVTEAHQKRNTAMQEIQNAFGFPSDTSRISKDEWLQKVAEAAVADLERKKNGEELLLGKGDGPLFDIMDTDKDGFVTLEECKKGYQAIGWDAASAESALKYFDTDDSGKISREAFIKACKDFWYKIDP